MVRTSLCGILAATLFSGCSTFLNLYWTGPPYGGLAADIENVKSGVFPETPYDREGLYFGLIDAPFSAVADTATLPITLPRALTKLIKTRVYEPTEERLEQYKERREQKAEEQWRRELESGTIPPQWEPEPTTLARGTP